MPFIHKLRFTSSVALSASLLFAGCAVGPNFKAPAPPNVPGYTPAPLSSTSSTPDLLRRRSTAICSGPGHPRRLVDALSFNPAEQFDRALAQGQSGPQGGAGGVGGGRENVLAQRGAYYPNVSAGFSASRQQTSSLIAPVPNANAFNFSLYTPQVSVSFVPDVFGLNRRTVESLKAQEQQARFVLAATHITLSSNVAAAAIQEASLRGQIAATRQLIDLNTATCCRSCATSSRRATWPAWTSRRRNRSSRKSSPPCRRW